MNGMKKLLMAVCAGMLLLGSCKENDIPLDFKGGAKAVGDTTYVVASTLVPPADPHQVLVEEFTGGDCSNCPGARSTLDAVVAANKGLVNVVSIHILPLAQGAPAAGAIYDLRTDIGTNIDAAIYNGGAAGGLPDAGIDRAFNTISGSILQQGTGQWSGMITAELGLPDSVNLKVQSVYNAATNIASISVTATYTQNMSTSQNLSVVIVEDSIIDNQEFNDGTVHSGYVFMNTFRDMVTAQPNGNSLQATPGSDVKETGRVFFRNFSYTVPTTPYPNAKPLVSPYVHQSPIMNPAHCRVVAFVSNNGTGGADHRIQQSAVCPLAP